MPEKSSTATAPGIADHTLVRCIGKGSYGEVWLGQNVIGAYRAVKIVRRRSFIEDRPFEREFEGIKKYEPVSRSHPGLVAILQIGRNEPAGYFYYIMEVADDLERGQAIDAGTYVPKTLSHDMARRGPLPLLECLQISQQLTRALGHLHRQNLVHRDLKPSNIILVKGTPKLADIGLVTGIGEGTHVGTPGYIPPEGPGSPQADVFSLGKVLYQLFTGKGCEEYPELPSGCEEIQVPILMRINDLVLKACDLDCRRRFQSADELGQVLADLERAVLDHPPAVDLPTAPPSDVSGRSQRVAILYKSRAEPDEHVRNLLEQRLVESGHQVFCDKSLAVGVHWAREIERQIRESDAVIVIISAASAPSEMLAYEVDVAWESAQHQQGRPRLLPVRLQFAGLEPGLPPAGPDAPAGSLETGSRSTLPSTLTRILEPLQFFQWNGPEDDLALAQDVLQALASPPKPAILGPPPKPEPAGGAVPLDSPFYIVRPTDHEVQDAIARRDSIVLVKGARQMGKTSLVARGVRQARQSGAKVVLTDFQKLNASHLATADTLFLTLGEYIAEQLELTIRPADVWEERRGANTNFERYLRREVLRRMAWHLVWAMDEVDRLFACDYGGEVFGLFRAWHNERALDPEGPWSRLTLILAYATEAHLFITDLNQSPFNVGTRLTLQDFTLDQVTELNRRYGSPLRTEKELVALHRLLGGQPYLVRRGLDELIGQRLTFAELLEQADRDEGIFGDHLRRLLVLVAKDEALTDTVRTVLRGQPGTDPAAFYRLRSAGVLKGDTPREARMRCDVYGEYLQRHLL